MKAFLLNSICAKTVGIRLPRLITWKLIWKPWSKKVIWFLPQYLSFPPFRGIFLVLRFPMIPWPCRSSQISLICISSGFFVLPIFGKSLKGIMLSTCIYMSYTVHIFANVKWKNLWLKVPDDWYLDPVPYWTNAPLLWSLAIPQTFFDASVRVMTCVLCYITSQTLPIARSLTHHNNSFFAMGVSFSKMT